MSSGSSGAGNPGTVVSALVGTTIACNQVLAQSIVAGNISGDGSRLTNLNPLALTGQVPTSLLPKTQVFGSMAAMRSYGGFFDGQVVYLAGFYAIGDGGQGLFAYSAAAASALPDDNGGTVIAQGSGRLLRAIFGDQYVRALWFGCRTDGSDASAALQNAANVAIAQGKTLYLDEGTYALASPLVLGPLNSVISIKGAGKNTTILQMTTSAAGLVFDLRGQPHTTPCTPVVTDLCVAGVPGSKGITFLADTTTSAMDSMRIENVRITGCAFGVYVPALAVVGTAAVQAMNNMRFVGNDFSGITDTCVLYEKGWGSHVYFTNNSFQAAGYGIRAGNGAVLGACGDCLITNNIFLANVGISVSVTPASSSWNVQITGNHFECTQQPVSLTNAQNYTITANSYGSAGGSPFVFGAQVGVSDDNATPKTERSVYHQTFVPSLPGTPTELFRIVTSTAQGLGTGEVWFSGVVGNTASVVYASVYARSSFVLDPVAQQATVTTLQTFGNASQIFAPSFSVLYSTAVATVWSLGLVGLSGTAAVPSTATPAVLGNAAVLDASVSATSFDTQIVVPTHFTALDVALGYSRADARAWMRTAGFGVWSPLEQYLGDWNARWNAFDATLFATQVASTGASFVVWNLGQNSGKYTAPNPYATQFALQCTTRDVVRDVAVALQALGLRMFVYIIMNAPGNSARAVTALDDPSSSWSGPATQTFLQNWQMVCAAWSKQWGTLVSGWWCDGLFSRTGFMGGAYNLDTFAAALRTGNPAALVSFNAGVLNVVKTTTVASEDYTTGETNTYLTPGSTAVSFLGPPQWDPQTHPVQAADPTNTVWNLTTYLGSFWGSGTACVIPAATLATYVSNVSALGGVLMLDAAIMTTGHIFPAHYNTLLALGKARGNARALAAQTLPDPLTFSFAGGATSVAGVVRVNQVLYGARYVGAPGTIAPIKAASLADARNIAYNTPTCFLYAYEYATGNLYMPTNWSGGTDFVADAGWESALLNTYK